MKKQKLLSRNFIWIISLLVFIFVLTLGGVIIFGKQEAYRTVKVFEISGKVGVVNNGVEYVAYPGMILEEGYSIVTSSNSYVRLSLDDDKFIKLEEGSKASFDTLGVLGSGKTTINLERGVILSEIVNPLRSDESYIINTPNAVLAVRGTLFKVEVNVNELGENNTNVFTYGGAVGSKRIEPNGNVIEEQVIIDAGYKTTVKMDDSETIYVVEDVADTSAPENTEPINVIEIPDEDMVDIYFATKNGHEMFIPMEDIEEELDYRGIDIEEEISVYDKIVSSEDKKTVTSIDDGHFIIVDNSQGTGDGNGQGGSQDNNAGNNQGNDNNSDQGIMGDGQHRHVELETIIDPTCTDEGRRIVSCSDCGEIISERALAAAGHEESEANVVKRATCLEEGVQEIKCVKCDILLSEEVIPVTEHQEKYVGTDAVHTQCMDCSTVLSTTHKYTSSVTKEATCKEQGELTYICSCGHNYTERTAKGQHKEQITTVEATCTKDGKVVSSCEFCNTVYNEQKIAATGHVHKKDGGKEGSHTECADCGTILSKSHTYTDTTVKQASCKENGTIKHACSCGYSYTTEVVGGKHIKANANATDTTCYSCGIRIVDFNNKNFPDATFLGLLKADGIDANSDGFLDEKEIKAVTDIRYHYAGITDATGLQYFTELTYLELVGNSASNIPFENLTKLELMNLGDTNITSADVTKLTRLGNLQLYGTDISSIDLSKNTLLAHLSLANCSNLTQLDLTNNNLLENIQLQSTGITDLQISDFSSLQEVWLSNCTMEKVRVMNCPNLVRLELPNGASTVDVSGCTSLLSINLSSVKNNLYSFKADGSGLRGIVDLSYFNSLQEVSLDNCKGLMGVNVSDCYFLSTFSVTDGGALYVNADNCLALNSADVFGNSYATGQGAETADFSAVEGFEPSKVTDVTGGSFTDGVFYFDVGSEEIVYTYYLTNSVYGQFIIKYN